MKVDAGLAASLAEVPIKIRELENAGYDAAITTETSHDPLFPLLLAAEHSERIEIMTSIVVAFARSPMHLAAQAHDLQAYSKGRLILGLGSQIKPHITKRFSMPWSAPAARMREFVLAMRAAWDCWYEGKPLNFRGDFYTHTLMTPTFTPTDIDYGAPKVYVAAVGPLMTETAAEVADGVICHAFTTRKYFQEVTLPAVERGLEKAGKDRSRFAVSYPGFLVTGYTDLEFSRARTAVCKQIAFYGSTPAYRPVLDGHGWGDLQSELNAMSKRGLWDEMGTLITEEILDQFAIVGRPDEIAVKFRARWGGAVDRCSITMNWAAPAEQRRLIADLRQ